MILISSAYRLSVAEVGSLHQKKSLNGSFFDVKGTKQGVSEARNERENIRKRQAEGIAAAKARGVRFGRPEKPLPENFKEIVKQWEKQQIDIETAASMCNMSIPTFYKRLKEYKILEKYEKI